MTLSSFNLSRGLRFALLLLMLASQGIAYAHDVGSHHALESDSCATCVIGHGLGAAVEASYSAPALEHAPALATASCIASPRAAKVQCRFARAPPVSHWNTASPN